MTADQILDCVIQKWENDLKDKTFIGNEKPNLADLVNFKIYLKKNFLKQVFHY